MSGKSPEPEVIAFIQHYIDNKGDIQSSLYKTGHIIHPEWRVLLALLDAIERWKELLAVSLGVTDGGPTRRQRHIVEVFKKEGGTQAARTLGISRRCVYDAIYRYEKKTGTVVTRKLKDGRLW